MGIDPLALQAEGVSPYAYVENNPMNLMDPDGMQPSSNTSNIPMGGGSPSAGSSWSIAGSAGYAFSFLAQGKAALDAFSINKPVQAQNWGQNLAKVQSNQMQVGTQDWYHEASPPAYNPKTSLFGNIDYYTYNLLEGVAAPLNMLQDNVPKNSSTYQAAKKEFSKNEMDAFLTYGGGYAIGKGVSIFSQITKPIVPRFVEGFAFNFSSRIEANSLKEFKNLVNQLSQPGSELTKKELQQLERLVAKFGGKLRYDLNPVKGKILKPHVQVEGLGSKVASRHIWLKQ